MGIKLWLNSGRSPSKSLRRHVGGVLLGGGAEVRHGVGEGEALLEEEGGDPCRRLEGGARPGVVPGEGAHPEVEEAGAGAHLAAGEAGAHLGGATGGPLTVGGPALGRDLGAVLPRQAEVGLAGAAPDGAVPPAAVPAAARGRGPGVELCRSTAVKRLPSRFNVSFAKRNATRSASLRQ